MTTKLNKLELTKQAKRVEAIGFASSLRGNLIITQALHHCIADLKAVKPKNRQEDSNIEDMEYLRDELYNQFPAEMYAGFDDKGIKITPRKTK
tara:strand:+ start:78 stop:356 length:279 start_codon:yes stop_codon:yes gene_type:complete